MKTNSWGEAFFGWLLCLIFWGTWFILLLSTHK